MKLGRMKYINTDPVYYGFDTGVTPQGMEIVKDTPSVLNRMLKEGALDISPVSSIAYAENQDDWLMLPDLSISCMDRVLSVLAVSNTPLTGLSGKKIILTSESATSNALFKYILKKNGIVAEISVRKIGCIDDVKGLCDAAVIIGDTAINHDWSGHFKHVYDLGELWNRCTGRPFVFGVWAVRKAYAEKHPESVMAAARMLARSKEEGLAHLDSISRRISMSKGLSADFCRTYFQHLNYDLGRSHLEGLGMFFDGVFEAGILERKVAVSFVGGMAESAAA